MHTDGVINVIKNPAVINRLKHSSSCTTCCNIENICFLCTDCAYVFHVVLTVNIDYFPNSISQLVLYIHGSVHRNSILIRYNSMQVFIYCKITLYVSGVDRTHHQEYIIL